METADSATQTPSVAAQDLAEHAVEQVVNDRVRSQGLARAIEWRNGVRTDAAIESSHQLLRGGLERIYASAAAASAAEAALIRHAEERGIAAALDRFMRRPHRFGRLALDRSSAREAAGALAPHASTFLIGRATRTTGSRVAPSERIELSPAQVRRDREERVLRAAARDRIRAAAARRWGFNDRGEYADLLPFGRNVRERDANGTVPEYLAEPESPVRTIAPYSDVATRTTFLADRFGVPSLVPAHEVQDATNLRPVEIPTGGFRLPFESPPQLLPGEPPRGLRGRTIPYPERPSGRPQANRFHTCVACSYGKHSAYERNYDLCTDCHRSVGPIPTDLFRNMVRDMKRRGLVERRAESFGHTRTFAGVATALADRWRAEHLVFGTSAGEPYVVHPQSDIATRTTLAANAEGGLVTEDPSYRGPETGDGVHPPTPHPFAVPAAAAFDRDVHPVTGVYPTTRLETVDLAEELGSGLRRTEDELMSSGARSARSEVSPFEVQPDLLDEGRVSGAVRLSDFTDQRAIEVSKGSGLSKEELFELSDASSGSSSPAARTRVRANQGHADPLFSSGPARDDLTSHALAGALTGDQREAVRRAAYERDFTEALHEDGAWERRRARLRIRATWREHTDWSGPLREITPPQFNRTFAGPTGVDEGLGEFETNRFLAGHRADVHGWLSAQHAERVRSWLSDRGISEPRTADRVAHALRSGKEADVVGWLERVGVSRETYDRDRAWLEEVNPVAFERSHPLNPQPGAIGDLTPETSIHDRLTARAAGRDLERRNWTRHGGALSRTGARSALEEYRDARAPSHDLALPPTDGAVASGRGAAEAPPDAAHARARLEAATTQFRKSVKRVFAEPRAFMRLFNAATPGERTRLLAGMQTAPRGLETEFGPAARLRGLPARGHDDRGSGEYGRIVEGAAVPARPTARAAEAAEHARILLEARREFRRCVRTVASMAGLPDAIHESRTRFRAATLGLLQDPPAFHRVFDAARPAEKRELLALMSDRPEALAARIGPAGRLAAGPGAIDPRWAPLSDALRVETRDTARVAAARGRTYVATLTRHAGRIRDALRVGRAQARSAVLEAMGKHFPEAGAIDAHARLSAEIDRLGVEISGRTQAVARIDRTFDGLVATAREFREQLKAVVVDPDAFVGRLKNLTAAEKHRVFDRMRDRPDDLAKEWGAAARMTGQAPRYTAVVVAHGRHYVDRALRFRDLVAESARALDLPASAGKADVCAALRGKVDALQGRVTELSAEREALPTPDLGKAAAQWRTLDEAERVHVGRAYPHLARTMADVEKARRVGASGVGRQKRRTALLEHSGQHRARNKGIELEF